MISRRAYLTALGTGSAIAVAGCLADFSSTTPVDVGIINNRDETETVGLEVKDDGDSLLLEHSIEVNPVSRGREDESWRPEL
ncbi:hypothetical protein AB7C87_05590 [Natrarchaeobius sp. A-rgal3]|uniref:hypothetical protein n=1 Tax=Natrarchaeobius versutus TaxID=1679078 RepID=UPI0035102451